VHVSFCDGLAATCQGWLGNKEAVLHAGEGPIQTARWSGTLAAWANSVSIKVAPSDRRISRQPQPTSTLAH